MIEKYYHIVPMPDGFHPARCSCGKTNLALKNRVQYKCGRGIPGISHYIMSCNDCNRVTLEYGTPWEALEAWNNGEKDE